jgi:AcrR family transcriptional regulator
VPKIAALTVAENRELRREALFQAAASLISRTGSARFSVTQVAQEVGLSRSAVYEYYSSAADLVADVLVDELMAWGDLIAEAVAAQSTTRERVTAWMRVCIDYAADGRHSLVRAAGRVDLPATRRSQVRDLHQALVRPLHAAIGDRPDADRLAQYIWGVTQAAIERVENGGDSLVELNAAAAFCTVEL